MLLKYSMNFRVGSKILPVAPIYNPVSEAVANKEIDMPNFFDMDFKGASRDSGSTGSIVSMATIVDRRTEMKFINLHEMVHGVVKEVDIDEIVIVELTADKINRLICNKKHCPAAVKFKEYGIGPLATGKGLGTLYAYVDPPVTYGISQTYGTMRKYGPFGLLQGDETSRSTYKVNGPENIVGTEVPEPCKFCANSVSSSCTSLNLTCKTSNAIRLKGGNTGRPIDELETSPLRLKGGGDEVPQISESIMQMLEHEIDMYSNTNPLRLLGGSPPGNELKAIVECNAALEQFDKIVAEFKHIVNCPHPNCPENPFVAKSTCKEICPQNEGPPNPEILSCLNLSCPFTTNMYSEPSRPSSTSKIKPDKIKCSEVQCPFQDPISLSIQKRFEEDKVKVACMSPTCPYKQYKSALLEPEAMFDKQFLPILNNATCGHSKCEYPAEKELPPIHWDCPDPLPKGNCKNPKCPYGPPKVEQVPRSPCGYTECPYALPEPCELLTCPFRERPCPYKKKRCVNNDDECDDPECVFNQILPCCPNTSLMSLGEPLSNMPSCGNPNCPLTSPAAAKRNPKMDKCYNPNCPFSKATADNPKTGANSGNQLVNNEIDCVRPNRGDVKGKEEGCECEKPPKTSVPLTCADDANLCTNPLCPTKIPCGDRKPDDICNNPDCLYNPSDQCLDCENIKCPKNLHFVQDSCWNVECPYNIEKKRREKLMKNICSNPKCKYVKESGVVMEELSGEGDDTFICKPLCGEIKEKKVMTKKKVKGKYVYSLGDTYPGMHMGHRECVMKRYLVPPNMGWLWNKPGDGFKVGCY